MIGTLMPVEWAYIGSLEIVVRWAGWIDFGATGGGPQWYEVRLYGDGT